MIGELRETSLHEILKQHYALASGGRTEQEVDGFIVDVESPDEIIEIQTGNFGNIHRKLLKLLGNGHIIRLVYPLVSEKYIRLYDETGENIRHERKSPLRHPFAFAGTELMRIPQAAVHPGLIVELVAVSIREDRVDDGTGSWRRKGVSIKNRELLEIKEILILENRESFNILLPETLPETFTNRDLATEAGITMGQASKLTWFLRKIENLEETGKKGRALLFQLAQQKDRTKE